MLDYVTDRWQEHFVTMDLVFQDEIEAFSKRPFFLLVNVDAPLMTRFARYRAKYASDMTLGAFVADEDTLNFGSTSEAISHATEKTTTATPTMGANGLVDDVSSVLPTPTSNTNVTTLSQMRKHSHVSITNTFSTLADLYAHLDSLNLTSTHRLRPGWDAYFLSLCNLASLRSNCMKRRVGAVLVSANRILATGYNGTPSGLTNCNQGGCPRCNNTLAIDDADSPPPTVPGSTAAQGVRPTAALQRGKSSACGQNLEECLCLHAEENALLEAGRAKIAAPADLQSSSGNGAVLYCNTCPCLRCAVKIIQCGIKKVVYQLEYSMDARTKHIFQESGVEIRQFHLE